MNKLEVGQYITILGFVGDAGFGYPYTSKVVRVKSIAPESITFTGNGGDYTLPKVVVNDATVFIEDVSYVPAWALNEAVAQANAPTRSFIHSNRAWYADHNRALANYEWIDDITLFIDDMPGEVHIEWINVDHQHVARLHVFDDSWVLLAAMPDVIALLATLDGQNVQPMTLCTMLEGLGFVDATETVNPAESKGE